MIMRLRSSSVDAWYQDTPARPRTESVVSNPVVFDMDVEVGTARQISNDGNGNTLVDAANRLLQRITGTNTAVSSGTTAVYSCLSGSGIGSAGMGPGASGGFRRSPGQDDGIAMTGIADGIEPGVSGGFRRDTGSGSGGGGGSIMDGGASGGFSTQPSWY
jgi:hypothetical protein